LQLARITDTPQLAMTEGEAKGFMQAWQNYLRHFSIPATQRTVDLMTALGVTTFIYTPRIAAVVQRQRQGPPAPAQPTARPAPENIFTFHPPEAPEVQH
jgi:hypothetical protein